MADELIHSRFKEGRDLIWRPEPIGRRRGVRVPYTASIRYATVGSDIVNEVQGPMRAVSLTGLLPPGTVAIVCPKDRSRSEFSTAIAANINNPYRYNSIGDYARPNPEEFQMPPDYFVLYPGQVHDFGQVLNGVMIWVWSPYTSIPAVDRGADPDGGGAEPFRMGQIPAGYCQLLCYPNVDGGIPNNGRYTPVSATMELNDFPSTDPNSVQPASGTYAAVTGASKVMINLHQDGFNGRTPITGTTDHLRVWWQNLRGLWLYSEADEFSAVGRGLASPTHATEVYAVSGVHRVFIQGVTTNNASWRATVTVSE